MRLAMIAAAFVIPIVGIALALTLGSSDTPAPVQVQVHNGSYGATIGTPLSVSAFRIANTSRNSVTIKRVRVAQAVPGLDVIGALAYRDCITCVTDSAVPPHVTPPTDVRAPALLPVSSFTLKPGSTLTLLLSVKLTQAGRVRVPPIRIDVTRDGQASAIVTASGPELCAGKDC
jgi:hypothetical protein